MSDAANEIAAAPHALEPAQAAYIIFKGLFERGPQRLDAKNKFIAVATITGALIEWKKQLLAQHANDAEKWKKKYDETKAALDEAKLRVAICIQEHGG